MTIDSRQRRRMRLEVTIPTLPSIIMTTGSWNTSPIARSVSITKRM